MTNMNKNLVPITVDKVKCLEVASKLVNEFSQHHFSRLVPELKYSKGITDPLEHRLFLFFTIAQDSMKPSNEVYRFGNSIAVTHGFSSLKRMTQAELKRIGVIFYGTGIKDPEKIMVEALKILKTKYDSDPKNIFSGIKDYESARKRLLEFHGVGPGIANLIIKNYVRFGYFQLDDPYDLPIKIDRHALRISIGNGVLQIPEGNHVLHRGRLERMLEGSYRAVCRENKIDPIALDDMKWIVGAYYCRDKNTQTCEGKCPLSCGQLVEIEKDTYIHYPSERRSIGKSHTAHLF
jgi:hypothetical protein